MRITVLGGAGKMGCISVQDLVNDSRVDEVVIADIDMQQAQIVAGYLNSPKVEPPKSRHQRPAGLCRQPAAARKPWSMPPFGIPTCG